MQTLLLSRHNGSLELTDISMPQPAHGQVRVRIAASGLDPLDTKIRAASAAHANQPLPLVLGIDMAGVVDAIGPRVTAFKVGDEGYGMTAGVGGILGSLAEYAAVDGDCSRSDRSICLCAKLRHCRSRLSRRIPASLISIERPDMAELCPMNRSRDATAGAQRAYSDPSGPLRGSKATIPTPGA